MITDQELFFKLEDLRKEGLTWTVIASRLQITQGKLYKIRRKAKSNPELFVKPEKELSAFDYIGVLAKTAFWIPVIAFGASALCFVMFT